PVESRLWPDSHFRGRVVTAPRARRALRVLSLRPSDARRGGAAHIVTVVPVTSRGGSPTCCPHQQSTAVRIMWKTVATRARDLRGTPDAGGERRRDLGQHAEHPAPRRHRLPACDGPAHP